VTTLTVDQRTLREALAAAGRKSAQLADLDEQISVAIATIEERLRACVSTRIETPIDARRSKLVFGKLDNKWQLIVEDRDRPLPLLKATRSARARVFAEGVVLRLITSAADQLDAQVRDRDLALFAAGEVIALLTEGPSS
jgi:hypothetical protein